MNPLLREFFDQILSGNPVFMTTLGALLALVESRRIRPAFLSALRIGVVFAGVAMAGGVLAAAVPAPVRPLILLVGVAAGVGLLLAWGELRGEWAGLPRSVLALVPLAGLQMTVAALPGPAEMVAAGAGAALGFAWAFITLAAVREAVRLAECDARFKTTPVMLLSMGMFALVLYGFVLL